MVLDVWVFLQLGREKEDWSHYLNIRLHLGEMILSQSHQVLLILLCLEGLDFESLIPENPLRELALRIGKGRVRRFPMPQAEMSPMARLGRIKQAILGKKEKKTVRFDCPNQSRFACLASGSFG